MTRKEYNECVRIWSDTLFRFALKTVQEQEDAKDVVQQAFEVLWKERKQVSMEKSKSFLFVVAYRKCMDVHRARKKVRERATEWEQPQTDSEGHLLFEKKELLNKALMQLDDKSRMLILLKDLEGYKYDEIATISELSMDQVKVYLHRARKKLKTILLTHTILV